VLDQGTDLWNALRQQGLTCEFNTPERLFICDVGSNDPQQFPSLSFLLGPEQQEQKKLELGPEEYIRFVSKVR
jgi:hypothetical protein